MPNISSKYPKNEICWFNFEKMKTAISQKLFLLLFVLVCVFTAYWIFHTRTILQDTGSPHSVVRLFNINNDLLYNIVTIFSLILLVISNLFYWRSGNGMFFLWSILYFIAGIISLSILEDARFSYTIQTGLLKEGFFKGYIAVSYLIVIVIIITLIDFFIIRYFRNSFLKKKISSS